MELEMGADCEVVVIGTVVDVTCCFGADGCGSVVSLATVDFGMVIGGIVVVLVVSTVFRSHLNEAKGVPDGNLPA